MTDTQFTIIIASVAPTITALGAMIVGILNNFKGSETKLAIAANDLKTDTIIEKAAEIHTLADGNLSKVTASLELANSKIEGLERMIKAVAESKPVANATEIAKVEVVNTTKSPVPTIQTKP